MSRRRRIVLWSALALITVLIVIAGLILSVTQTDYGQDQVRRYVQTWIAGKTHGTFYVGRITGGLFRGVTIDSVEIRDEKDSLFVASGPVRIRYDMRDLFDRRVLLSHVDVRRLKVRLNEQADGKWNYQHIFPSGPKKPHGATIKFGLHSLRGIRPGESGDVYDSRRQCDFGPCRGPDSQRRRMDQADRQRLW
jgi:hypothetical protein